MKLNLQAAIDGKLDEQLNLALCEWLGWKQVEQSDGDYINGPSPVYPWTNGKEWVDESGEELPNHITARESLGLVHEVEKQLTDMQHGHFRNCLGEVVGDVALFSRKFTSATARQRVIAILQTVKPEIFE